MLARSRIDKSLGVIRKKNKNRQLERHHVGTVFCVCLCEEESMEISFVFLALTR